LGGRQPPSECPVAVKKLLADSLLENDVTREALQA
jgi:hypothetical protein